MKKVLTAILMATTLTTAWAQKSEPGDVFYQVKNAAELAIEDPNADDATILLSQYKLAALGFLVNQGVKETNGKGYSLSLMDRKALALNTFLTKYVAEITNLSGNQAAMKGCIKRYWQASHQHPMYPKMQENEDTQAFAATLLCFSLNTDWEAAVKEINKK